MIKTIRTLFPAQSPIIFILFLFASNFLLAQPANDEPCNATTLTVGDSCNYIPSTNVGATKSEGIPRADCSDEFLDLEQFDNDVWFKVVVPSNGSLIVNLQANGMTDSGMAFYVGECGNLTVDRCSDNSLGLMSQLSVNYYAPGSTVWIRVWSAHGSATGTFDICAIKQTNVPHKPICDSNSVKATDDCESSPKLCTFDGYCGNTSSEYTPTSWNWTQLYSAVQGCIKSIDNDSYMNFVASAKKVTIYVWVTTTVNNGGIQLAIFSTDKCGSGNVDIHYCNGLIPPTSQPLLIYLDNLTPGQEYYILVDGVNNDVCNYTIALPKNSGIDIPVYIKPLEKTICLGSSIDLTAAGGNGKYDWKTSPNLTELNKTDSSIVVATPLEIGKHIYKVVSTDSTALGGCPTNSTATITVEAKPTATLLKDTAICLGEPLTLEVKNIHYGEFIDSLVWNTGDTTKFINIKQTGNYTATLYSFCEPSGLTLPSYVDVRDCSVEVPNVITPNGDGANDYFTFIGEKDIFITFKVIIVNRWGNPIIDFIDPQNGKWDGKDKSGKLVPDGVYFYTLKGKTINNQEVDKQGFIQVFGQ